MSTLELKHIEMIAVGQECYHIQVQMPVAGRTMYATLHVVI